MNRYNPAHPGEFIREVYLEPLELSYRADTQNKLQSLIRVKSKKDKKHVIYLFISYVAGGVKWLKNAIIILK